VKNYTVKRYQENNYNDWNAFISKAKNATFLFDRDFMDYHKERFEDYSLIVLDKEKWVAVLPANVVGNQVFSHQGLSYGSLVYDEKVKLASVIEIFKSVLSFLNDNKIEKLQLKLIPSIYHQKPAEELNYALFLAKAQLIRRDSMSVIDLRKPFLFSKTRKECIRRGLKNELIIKEELDFKLFWEEVLIPNLEKKHQVKPVHSKEEIKKLQQKFPNNIRHFNVYQKDKIVAGTTVFVSKNVAHPQYVSGMNTKNELGSLDFLYHHLITSVFKDKLFFDFGISNEEKGTKLNQGLAFWKESFGASTIVHDFYEVEPKNYRLLETILK